MICNRLPFIILSLITLTACVGAGVGEGGLGEGGQDSLVGNTFPTDSRVGLPDQFVAGDAMRIADASTCIQGERVGVCLLCDAQGQPALAADDDECPRYDCGPPGRVYEKEIEGDEVVCYQVDRGEPLTNQRCMANGECASESEYCSVANRLEIERGPRDPCRTMVGCDGQTPPSFNELSLGAMCNGMGFCRSAPVVGVECSVQVPGYCLVEQATDARFFCESGSANGRNYCEFFVAPPGGGRTTCVAFCNGMGFDSCNTNDEECCWNNATDNTCSRSAVHACTGAACNDQQGCTDQICRCFLRQ